MRTEKLFWQLLFGYLAVMLLPLLVASWYTSTLYNKFYTGHTVTAETTHAYLIGKDLLPFLRRGDYGRTDSLCKQLSRSIGMRITVVLPSGKVIGDSEKLPDSMENHAYRPEIREALRGVTGVSKRLSTTLHIPMMYVASPVKLADSVAAIVRTAVPLSFIKEALGQYHMRVLFAALIMAGFAVVLTFALIRRITRPVRELERGAERFARGDFSGKIGLPAIDELKHLAVALNDMAQQLNERIQTVTRQRNEHETILSSMSEGVIAVDVDERVLSVNAAAAGMFGIDREIAAGRLFVETIRNSAMQDFMKRALAGTEPVESDLILPPPAGFKNGCRERSLQLHGTILRDGGNSVIGALLVASDVTRLRRLETIRKEFVANVSHELRTPLTTIKGFVETLREGALEKREEAIRFLSIISEQVDRLDKIIEDLLTLAVIERGEETRTLLFERHSILETIQAAAGNFEHQAADKKITMKVSGDAGVFAEINRPLFEQAVGNLIDNAVKYSDPGSEVSIEVNRQGSGAVVAVRDRGMGIAPEHLDRLFERFYRVDKARSRKLGGTGLGLSIVKHIAVTHGGRVAVESAPGRGSVFSIIIPDAQARNTR
ncbi:MAG: HAMP domain-containing protein [Chitinispirillaceae bacterium]|nr:HAMP domain-containing protein [Chitinispirillaceae bacterium]